jgi:hypothetical protein
MSIIRILGITIFSAVLANCGSQLVETPSATPWPSATVQVITQTSPTNTIAVAVATPIATPWPSATVQVITQTSPTNTIAVAVATPIATQDTAEVTANTADSLASGLTPEGYHVLGDMAAPITFVDYSDYF